MKLHLGRGVCPTDAGENNLCRELSPASVGRAEKSVFVSEREIFMKTDNKRYIRLLAVLCMIVYFVSYLTRINYSAVLVEIVNSRGISKTEASLAVTASALSYGIGQLVSGYFGDRIKPHRIVFAGLLCTAAMNFILPLFASTAATVAIWTVNGFAQAMMWPPIVKILTAKTEGADYQKATVMVSSWGSSGATIFVYLVSPLIIHSMGWKAVFFFASTAALLMSAAWMILFPRVNGKLEDISVLRGCGDRKYEKMTGRTAVLIALVMIAIVIHGSLRDGITTWMPTYVSETFNLKSEISILSGILLPVFSIICSQLTSFVNRRFVGNIMLNSGIIFVLAALSSTLLALLGGKSAPASIVALALTTGCMYGINYLLTCLAPAFFVKYGKVSFISGLLNSCTYVGSAVSTYGIALLTNDKSWSYIAGIWAVTALAGAVLSLAISAAWGKFTGKSKA